MLYTESCLKAYGLIFSEQEEKASQVAPFSKPVWFKKKVAGFLDFIKEFTSVLINIIKKRVNRLFFNMKNIYKLSKYKRKNLC